MEGSDPEQELTARNFFCKNTVLCKKPLVTGFGNLSWGYDSFWVGGKAGFEPTCTQNSRKDDLVSSHHRLRWTECELRSKVGHLHASRCASTCPWCSSPKTKALASKAPYLQMLFNPFISNMYSTRLGSSSVAHPPKNEMSASKICHQLAILWGWSEVLESLFGWTRKVSIPILPSRKSFQIWDQIIYTNIANKNDIRDSNYRF